LVNTSDISTTSSIANLSVDLGLFRWRYVLGVEIIPPLSNFALILNLTSFVLEIFSGVSSKKDAAEVLEYGNTEEIGLEICGLV
jgi:hypothetical protein